MSTLTVTPKDFIFRAMRTFRNQNPDWPFMPTQVLAEELKISEEQLDILLLQLHEYGMIELHPMWPSIKEAFIA